MYGFYLAIGRQGSGKTAFITKLLVDNYTNDKRVYSNYSLFGIEYERITFDSKKNKNSIDILEVIRENPDYFNNSIMLLDEIHIYFDSRDYMRQNNRIIQNFFSQLRKRNILLLATTQYILHLDVRIRRQALAVFQMTNLKDGIFRVDVHEIDGYFTRFIKTELVNLNDYFRYYDTNELIE
ncbi:MAG TPA: zonular occludens toxin domain-containing protein [Clostridia bacterium]